MVNTCVIFFWMLLVGSTGVSDVENSQRDFSIVQKTDGQCLLPEEKQQAVDSLLQKVDDLVQHFMCRETSMVGCGTPGLRFLVGHTPATQQSIVTMTTQQPTRTEDPTYTCDGTPGWRRVVYIDMTNPSTSCPSGLQLTSYSKRTCGRANSAAGCSASTFSVGGSQYSQVCGRIIGYQFGATSAFFDSFNGQTIDGYYVEGVSLTHGAPGSRQHIWTFAAGLSETDNSFSNERCPCDTSHSVVVSPPFVGNDYYCESGINGPWPGCSTTCGSLYPNDPLWDGQNCLISSSCCQFNNPPWFTKTLPSSTVDDIELRLCSQDHITTSDTPLELIELYVQ